MKILELELQNFRCFEQEPFEFSEKFNILIGDNATGKTTILDAIVSLISLYIHRLSLSDYPKYIEYNFQSHGRIEDSDVKIEARIKNQRKTNFDVKILCQAFINKSEISWWIKREIIYSDDGGMEWYGLGQSSNIYPFAESMREKYDNSEIINLPIVAYYGIDRLWRLLKKGQDVEIRGRDFEENILARKSRFWGYKDCLQSESNLILDIFRFEDIDDLLGEEYVLVHQAISNALSSCQIDGWSEINYDQTEDTLLVKSENGKSQHFSNLSDGVKNMIGMVSDIAFRCAILNPHLGVNAPQETEGVIFIDEIDLHLHPRWQRRIVEDLQRTFPNIQFFATTHSPFIIQSLRQGKLINLNDTPYSEYEGQSIEDIAEDIMGIELPQYSRRKLAMLKAAEEYYQVLQEAANLENGDQQRLEILKQRLDELSLPFSDNPAYHAFLNMERLAKGV
jgi:predicted ATP-binding protein involved in virulence